MTIYDLLVWMSGGLGATFVASYFAERSAWFQALQLNTKSLYKTLLASGVAILAYVTYTYVPAEVWVMLTPYWQLVLGVISANYGVEVFHFFDKKLATSG